MFKEVDGPTALRVDLVHSLCFSMDVVEIEGPEGSGRFCAGIGAVWNGNKGYVAVLLRHVTKPILRRLMADQPFTTLQDLEVGVDESIAYVEAMGFTMDHPEFESLGSDRRKRRLRCWNDIRKVDRELRHLEADAERSVSKRRKRKADERQDEDGDEGSDDGKAVLGRLALVRKEEAARLHPLAKLLSYF
jgi:hypothetical protein